MLKLCFYHNATNEKIASDKIQRQRPTQMTNGPTAPPISYKTTSYKVKATSLPKKVPRTVTEASTSHLMKKLKPIYYYTQTVKTKVSSMIRQFPQSLTERRHLNILHNLTEVLTLLKEIMYQTEVHSVLNNGNIPGSFV